MLTSGLRSWREFTFQVKLETSFWLKNWKLWTSEFIIHCLRDIEAKPGYEISILVKNGCYAEAADFSSIIPYIQNLDKDNSKTNIKMRLL